MLHNQAAGGFQLMHGFETFDVFTNNHKNDKYCRIIEITAKCSHDISDVFLYVKFVRY